jgi:cytochrome c biogenesis protein CcmG, thiol:disulfide interchange protein DsbE
MTETIESPSATALTDTKEGSGSFRWLTVGIWAGVITLLAVLGWGLIRANAERPGESGRVVAAPGFEVQFFEGYEWEGRPSASLSDFRGQVVVLNFWASWCVECRLEADLLEQAWRQYRDQGVVFLGIAYIDVEPKSLAYMEEFNITYPNGPDLRSTVSSKYEVTGVPETFFIDREGKVAHVQIGPLNQATLYGLLGALVSASG